jgi:hypothetical protein
MPPRGCSRAHGDAVIDPEPLLPTRGYRVLCHDATLIDLEAEGMWPLDTQLEFNITTLVIGLPRQVVVQRCNQADVDLVLRDDAAMWPPRIRWGARARPGHRAGERK